MDKSVAAKIKQVKLAEATMRQRASGVGNLVANDVPVSQTEVRVLNNNRNEVSSNV